MQILFPLFKTSEKLWPLLFILLFSTETSGGDFCVQPKFVKATTMELVSFLPHLTSQLTHTSDEEYTYNKGGKGGPKRKSLQSLTFQLVRDAFFLPATRYTLNTDFLRTLHRTPILKEGCLRYIRGDGATHLFELLFTFPTQTL